MSLLWDWVRGSTGSLPWPGWWAGGGRRWSQRTRLWAAQSGPAGFQSYLPSSLQHCNETTRSLLIIVPYRGVVWKVTHKLSFVTSPCTLDQVGQRVWGEGEEASVLQTGPHLKQIQSLMQLKWLWNPDVFVVVSLGLTFPGILAASTERQFTQEAITSTGGLITDVNLSEIYKWVYFCSPDDKAYSWKLVLLKDVCKSGYLCSSM